MPYAPADVGRIYYEVHGDSGPWLVLCHGSGANHACWWQQVPHFQDRYRVVTMDFPGYGKSDSSAEGYFLRDFPTAIAAVFEHAGIDQGVLLGQSMGCDPALSFTVANPGRVSCLILAHSTGGIRDDEIASLARADREESNRTTTVMERLWSSRTRETEPAKVFLYHQMGNFNRASRGNVVAGQPTTSLADVRAAVDAGVELHFIGGTSDLITSQRTYARLREALPTAGFEMMAGEKHLTYWESPVTFNRAVDRVLEAAGAV